MTLWEAVDRLAVLAAAGNAANPAHEAATAEFLRERLPRQPVTLSHRVVPALREYQRASTAVANAYVQPLAAGYLRGLEEGLRCAGVAAPVRIMLSTAAVETAADVPIRLVESGPAGGSLAGAWWGRLTGHDDVLAFDMGGTTAKAVFHRARRVRGDGRVGGGACAPLQRGSGLPPHAFVNFSDLASQMTNRGGQVRLVASKQAGSVFLPSQYGWRAGPSCPLPRGPVRTTSCKRRPV